MTTSVKQSKTKYGYTKKPLPKPPQSTSSLRGRKVDMLEKDQFTTDKTKPKKEINYVANKFNEQSSTYS